MGVEQKLQCWVLKDLVKVSGFGTLLMKYIMRHIENEGYKKIVLKASDQLNQRGWCALDHFYQMLGFESLPLLNGYHTHQFSSRIVGISSDGTTHF